MRPDKLYLSQGRDHGNAVSPYGLCGVSRASFESWPLVVLAENYGFESRDQPRHVAFR